MSEIIFEIRNKNQKVTSIQAYNFKEAMKKFAEAYDMPDANSGEKTDDDLFYVLHNDTNIEFKYVHTNAPCIEYTLNGITDLMRINKTGYKVIQSKDE